MKNTGRRIFVVVTSIFLALLLAACGGITEVPQQEITTAQLSVTIVTDAPDSQTVSYTVRDEDGVVVSSRETVNRNISFDLPLGDYTVEAEVLSHSSVYGSSAATGFYLENVVTVSQPVRLLGEQFVDLNVRHSNVVSVRVGWSGEEDLTILFWDTDLSMELIEVEVRSPWGIGTVIGGRGFTSSDLLGDDGWYSIRFVGETPNLFRTLDISFEEEVFCGQRVLNMEAQVMLDGFTGVYQTSVVASCKG